MNSQKPQRNSCSAAAFWDYWAERVLGYTSIGYDDTSNKFASQRDRVKVKVAVIFLEKTLSSL